jgi:signal transduction histidine kinase
LGIVNPWLISALLAALALAGWQGYRLGESVSEGRHAAALVQAQRDAQRASDLASRKEAERLAMKAERDRLAQDLEDLANADADADRRAIGADSVSRLNRR